GQINKGNLGQINSGQNNSGQNNSGQNNQGSKKGDGGIIKVPGENPGSKSGIPFNGKNDHGNNPGSNSGSKFGPKIDDLKNGDHRDKDFKFGDHNDKDHGVIRDKNHDGKPDNPNGKDFFDHRNGDNHSNAGNVFKNRDFHGKDSSKAAFNKWNDVW